MPKLNELLDEISPWPTKPSDYSNASWESLIAAAQHIQQCKPSSVDRVLREYQSVPEFVNSSTYATRIRDDSKLLLLIRVIFDLPQSDSLRIQKFFPWRLNGSERNKDGGVNVSWPISWDKGKPSLISGETSIQGVVGVYDVAGEYDYFLIHYPFRKF